jgi:hypothetical protein
MTPYGMAEQIESAFTYHNPLPGQPERYTALRDEAKEFAHMINDMCPQSREKSLALTKLEETIMWANAAIARHDNPETSRIFVKEE